MKEFVFTIKEPLAKGLAPTLNPRNKPMLSDSVGAFPFDEICQSLQVFASIDVTAILGGGALAFPYPQLFVTDNFVIVCTRTVIYEWDGSSLTSKTGTLTTGIPWSCLDFKDYIYLTNGQVAVTRNPASKVYAVDATVPFATCCCNFNGQVLLGSVNKAVTSI